MTMNMTMLRLIVAGMAGLASAAAVIGDSSPGAAAAIPCQRSVAIDPQVTVSETSTSLTLVVHTGGCAVAGQVSYTVTEGTARRGEDFLLGNGTLMWDAGDVSQRRITATILRDYLSEATFETFSVTLTQPSPDVRIAGRPGLARIFDDDTDERLATLDSRICLVAKDGCADARPAAGGGAGVRTFEPGLIIDVPFVVNTAATQPQTVSFETSDGTLLAGIHYQPVYSTVTIPAGATVVLVPVQLLPDALCENSAYLNVNLTGYSAGNVVANTGQITVWG